MKSRLFLFCGVVRTIGKQQLTFSEHLRWMQSLVPFLQMSKMCHSGDCPALSKQILTQLAACNASPGLTAPLPGVASSTNPSKGLTAPPPAVTYSCFSPDDRSYCIRAPQQTGRKVVFFIINIHTVQRGARLVLKQMSLDSILCLKCYCSASPSILCYIHSSISICLQGTWQDSLYSPQQSLTANIGLFLLSSWTITRLTPKYSTIPINCNRSLGILLRAWSSYGE